MYHKKVLQFNHHLKGVEFMLGFVYKGNNKIAQLFDTRLKKTFGYDFANTENDSNNLNSFSNQHNFSDENIQRYLCIDSNKMLFSHNIMNNGSIIPQNNPDMNFYITINAKSPRTAELVTNVHSMQEIWHDFGIIPEGEPLSDPTNLAFDLFDSYVSYSKLNEKIKAICGGKSKFTVAHNHFGGGIQCYYDNKRCTVEDLFSIFN